MMVTFEAEINALDFAQIDAALARARIAIEQAQRLSLTDLNPTALLGDLGTAITAVGEVRLDTAAGHPVGGQALAALGGLSELPDLTGLEEVLGGLDKLTDRLSVLVAVFSGGGDGAA